MKVAVLVSGGVDSSVALRLLQEQGHEVTAFYLKIWLEDELAYLGACPWEEDLKYVRQVCEQASVPLEVVPLQKEYCDRVVAYTVAEIKAGRTPNPDVQCNKRIKFGAFLEKIGPEFDKIATGHYARIAEQEGVARLMTTPDHVKDQTYFLSHLHQEQLKRLLFPLGALTKARVREMAREFDLPNKDRKDSQGICFLGKLKFADFVKHHLGTCKGDLLEFETAQKLGEHDGFWFYTIGQRQGIGLSGGPWYVAAKSPKENIVYISKSYHAPDKERDTFEVTDLNWLTGAVPLQREMQVKLRHGAQRYACTLDLRDENRATVKLTERDQGIAAGQFAVFYDGQECLGSGIIA